MENPTKTLYRVYITTQTMLHDRGYMVTNEKDFTFEEFIEKFGSRIDPNVINKEEMSIYTKSKLDPSDKIFVFFIEPGDKKGLTVSTIKQYFERCESEGVRRAVLICETKLTPMSQKCIEDCKKRDIIIEHFKESELVINITQHELVPKHQPLKENEKLAVLQRYRIKQTQLPRVKIDDPVARYYGLQRGDVVKIIRKSETGGRYVTYRFVI